MLLNTSNYFSYKVKENICTREYELAK